MDAIPIKLSRWHRYLIFFFEFRLSYQKAVILNPQKGETIMETRNSQVQSSSSKNTLSPEITSIILAEYNTLRDEILRRIDTMNQINALALIAPGTILAYGLQSQNATILLLYPILALFLAVAWSINDRRCRELGYYIHTQIETRFEKSCMGWEHFMDLIRVKHKFFDMDNVLATSGIFLGTEGVAILVGWIVATKFATVVPLTLLLVIAFLSVMITAVVLFRPYRHQERVRIYDAEGVDKQKEVQ
jgi:hypothetical protein